MSFCQEDGVGAGSDAGVTKGAKSLGTSPSPDAMSWLSDDNNSKESGSGMITPLLSEVLLLLLSEEGEISGTWSGIMFLTGDSEKETMW